METSRYHKQIDAISAKTNARKNIKKITIRRQNNKKKEDADEMRIQNHLEYTLLLLLCLSNFSIFKFL